MLSSEVLLGTRAHTLWPQQIFVRRGGTSSDPPKLNGHLAHNSKSIESVKANNFHSSTAQWISAEAVARAALLSVLA